jgi:hypothetical protein
VPGSSPLVSFEGYLDQINTAAGSGATMADTLATDVTVPGGSGSSGLSAGWYAVIAVGGLIVLAIVGWQLWRRRRQHPQTPTPQAAT